MIRMQGLGAVREVGRCGSVDGGHVGGGGRRGKGQ